MVNTFFSIISHREAFRKNNNGLRDINSISEIHRCGTGLKFNPVAWISCRPIIQAYVCEGLFNGGVNASGNETGGRKIRMMRDGKREREGVEKRESIGMKIGRERERQRDRGWTKAFKRISSNCALLQRVGTVALLYIAKQIGWSDLSHGIATLTRKTEQPINCFWTLCPFERDANQRRVVRIENTSSPRSLPPPLNPSVRAIVAKSADKTFQPV